MDRDGSGLSVHARASPEPETIEGNRPPCLQKPLEPETIEGNRPSCLQKFLDLEPTRATGPRVYNRSFHLNQRVKPLKTNETFNTGRTSDHVTSKLEKKP